MEMDESRRLEALRMFLSTRQNLPLDQEDWSWIVDMAAYLRDGTIPEFEDDGDELPAAENNQAAVQ